MQIEFHAPSIVLFAGASVVIALMLGLALGRYFRSDPAIRWLSAANGFFLAAAALYLLQARIGADLAPILINAGVYCAISCAFFAVMRAENRPAPIVTLGLVGLASVGLHAAQTAIDAPAAVILATNSVIGCALTFYMSVTTWRLMRPYAKRMANLITLPFGAFSLAYFARAAGLVLTPDGIAPFLFTLAIITIPSWASFVLSLGMIALRERQARRALRAALARVEASSEAKSRFLRGVSHQLRTPLNGVLGLSELLRAEPHGPLTEKYRAYVNGIHDNGARMLDLVTDLLDIAAFETGNMDVSYTEVNIAELLGRISARHEPDAAKRAVRLVVSREDDAPATVMADRERLSRMLSHLLGNAIKYAAAGGVAALLVKRADSGGAWFLIEDDGPGMSAEDIEIALELFGRVDGVENEANGAGVGLTLAQEIARAHGADFEIRSVKGDGAQVSVILPPVPKANRAVRPAPATTALRAFPATP